MYVYQGQVLTAIVQKVMNMPKWVISRVIESSPFRGYPKPQPVHAITVPAAYPTPGTQRILTLARHTASAKPAPAQYLRPASLQPGLFIDLLA
jgi:hypothetical protein